MSRPLPPNWTLEFTDDGSPYYYNSVTGETSWDKPVASAPSNPYSNKANTVPIPSTPGRVGGSFSKLPPGWEETYTDDGELYYYNSNTGETAWEKPVAKASSPPTKAVPKTPNNGPPKGRALPTPRNDANYGNNYASPPPRRNDGFASPSPRRPARDDNFEAPPSRENGGLRRSNSFSGGMGPRTMSPPPRGYEGPATTSRLPPPGGRKAPVPQERDTPSFNAPSSSTPGDKSGWLTKQGHVMPNWKRRWFVLRGSQLSYYGTQSDPQPKGVISLDNVKYEKGLPPGSVSEPSIRGGNSAPPREPKASTPKPDRNGPTSPSPGGRGDAPPKEGGGRGGGGRGDAPPKEGGGRGEGAPKEGGRGGGGRDKRKTVTKDQEKDYIKNKNTIQEEYQRKKEEESNVAQTLNHATCSCYFEMSCEIKDEPVYRLDVDYAGIRWVIYRRHGQFQDLANSLSRNGVVRSSIFPKKPAKGMWVDSGIMEQTRSGLSAYLDSCLAARGPIFDSKYHRFHFCKFIGPTQVGDEKGPDFIMPFVLQPP